MLESSSANLIYAKILWMFNASVDIMNFEFEFLGFVAMKSSRKKYVIRSRCKSAWWIKIKIR
jgi:hypothetical protein